MYEFAAVIKRYKDIDRIYIYWWTTQDSEFKGRDEFNNICWYAPRKQVALQMIYNCLINRRGPINPKQVSKYDAKISNKDLISLHITEDDVFRCSVSKGGTEVVYKSPEQVVYHLSRDLGLPVPRHMFHESYATTHTEVVDLGDI